MPTPVFDREILRLRKRLGDIYNIDGTEITTANVGNADAGDSWKRDELVSVYNNAVRYFIDYVLSMFSDALWADYIPGYIVYKEGLNVAISGNVGSKLLSDISPAVLRIVAVSGSGGEFEKSFGYRISPAEFFRSKSTKTKTRAEQLMYTVMTDSQGSKLYLINPSDMVDLIYVKQHADIQHGGSEDLSGITEGGFERIQVFAEMEAKKHKYFELDPPTEQLFSNMIQIDSMNSKRRFSYG